MKRSLQRLTRCLIAAALLLLATLLVTASDPTPYRLTLDLSGIGVELSSAMRDDLEREILVRLREHGCFSEVRVSPPDPIGKHDLLLRVDVDAYREQRSFESSVHGTASSDRAEPVLSTAEIAANVELRLLQSAEQLELRQKSGQRYISWRPPTAQNAMFEGRQRWIDNVGQMTRKFACQGGASKLTREIEKRRRESR